MLKLISNIPGIVITPTEHPLNWSTEISESAKREIILRVALEGLFETLSSAYFDLGSNEFNAVLKNPERAKSDLLSAFELHCKAVDEHGENSWFEEYKEQAAWYLEALNESHCGDCTAIPASCMRCHAESMIGVDTMPIGKTAGNYILSAMNKSETLEDAIQTLSSPLNETVGFEAHWARWSDGKESALKFLKEHQAHLEQFRVSQGAQTA